MVKAWAEECIPRGATESAGTTPDPSRKPQKSASRRVEKREERRRQMRNGRGVNAGRDGGRGGDPRLRCVQNPGGLMPARSRPPNRYPMDHAYDTVSATPARNSSARSRSDG
jgi:hypothetical protein